METLEKAKYEELVTIRKELQNIRAILEFKFIPNTKIVTQECDEEEQYVRVRVPQDPEEILANLRKQFGIEE